MLEWFIWLMFHPLGLLTFGLGVAALSGVGMLVLEIATSKGTPND